MKVCEWGIISTELKRWLKLKKISLHICTVLASFRKTEQCLQKKQMIKIFSQETQEFGSRIAFMFQE